MTRVERKNDEYGLSKNLEARAYSAVCQPYTTLYTVTRPGSPTIEQVTQCKEYVKNTALVH